MPTATPTRRPSILFLMSDEHRPDVTGYEGNTVVRTPVLDELARTGVVFRNAYTPSPICVPGRQAMMSGQFPRTCRCERYGEDLPPFSMTFARRLSQYAYDTICVGKLHHMGVDQMQGWTQRAAGDVHVDRRYIEGRDQASFDALPRAEDGCGKWSDAKEILRAGIVDHRRESEKVRAACSVLRGRYIAPDYDRPNPHQPVLLKASFTRPHYPYHTTADKFEYYLPRVQPFLDEPVFDHPFLSERAVKVGQDVTVRDMRRVTAAYYGMIEELDEDYGTILDTLRRVGQDPDDWIIIYTSDHGEMLGEHGIWEKQKFFEASARVPLIIRYPKRFAPRVVEENVNLCDLFATLCELTDVPTPDGLDSRSLVPLMTGETRAWHERYHNETVSQFGGRNLMIKRNALKYQYYGPQMPEVLFDLQRDPTERANFIDEPRYAEAVKTFRQRRDALGFSPTPGKPYVNAGYA
jgi:choline-sulfatase